MFTAVRANETRERGKRKRNGKGEEGGRRDRKRQGGKCSSTRAYVTEGLSLSETLQGGAAGLTGKLKQNMRP